MPENLIDVAAAATALGVPPADAAALAEVLRSADRRGIPSHGTARLEGILASLRAGKVASAASRRILGETATTILIDAGNGLGPPAAIFAMNKAIEKAKSAGSALASVRNSNDFGIAGYYAMLALPHDMIGIATTNAARVAVPTFGRDVLLGSNPLAFAVPANEERAFVLDFSTTSVQRSDVERRAAAGEALGAGWAADGNGNETRDPAAALRGALLPLGGEGTDCGGHKGYGLGLLVDILCGVLAGGAFGAELPLASHDESGGKLSHFFAAIRIDAFRDPLAFKSDMDALIRQHRRSEKAPGYARIYVAGEPEWEAVTSKLTT